MRDQEAPKFLRLENYKLQDERSKILFGVSVHFAVLRKDIDLTANRNVFKNSIKGFLDQQLHHYLNCPYQNFNQIADAFGVNINMWQFYNDLRTCPQPRNPNLERKIHANYNAYGAIHFDVKDGMIENFIIKPEDFGLNREMTVNFKQAIACYGELSLDEVNEKFPENQIQLPRGDGKLHNIFGFGLEIWTRMPKKCSKDVTDYVPTPIFKSRFKSHVKLMADSWSLDKTLIDIKDQFSLYKTTLFQCPKDYCLYATSNRQTYDGHCERCSDETIVDYEQCNLLENDIVEWMIEEKFLTQRPKIGSKHLHYDLETLLRPNHSSTSKTECFGEERIISIGVSDNITDETRSHVFARENLDEVSLDKMVNEFWSYLLLLREDFRRTLPAEVNKAFFQIKSILYPTEKDVFGKTIKPPISDPLQIKLRAAYNYLDGLRSLKVVGWNSENFGMGSKKYLTHKNESNYICFYPFKRSQVVIAGAFENV